MRDYRDAKAMAQLIRAGLAAKGQKITISGSLELIAEAFGAADWNTLSATIKAAEAKAKQAAQANARPGVMFSEALAATLHRATDAAAARRNQHTTVGHLLLALTDDPDAIAVMEACRVGPGRVMTMVSELLDAEPGALAPPETSTDRGEPTAAFHRVIRHTVAHAQEAGRGMVTGANVLVAIFSERNPAAELLLQLGMTRHDAVNFIVHGIRKDAGRAA
jgi:hypothetical protein